jgi:hypothetical protein
LIAVRRKSQESSQTSGRCCIAPRTLVKARARALREDGKQQNIALLEGLILGAE